MENTVETIAPPTPNSATITYDKNSPQTLKFIDSDEEYRYEYEFSVPNLSDEILLEFDRLQEIVVLEDGIDSDDKLLEIDQMTACKWFFNNHVNLVGGFEGELPEDWQKSFTDDQKQAVVMGFMEADVKTNKEVKTLAKRVFGAVVPKNHTVTITADFNGNSIDIPFSFPEKLDRHIRQYRKITGAAKFKKGREGTFIPPNWKELNDLYSAIGVQSEGNPAIHLKVLALRERYDSSLRKQVKK